MLIIVEEKGKSVTHVTKGSSGNTVCGKVYDAGDYEIGLRGSWLTCRKCKEALGKDRRGKDPKIDRISILDAIMDCFVQMHQTKDYTAPDCLKRAADYSGRAEELIKLLEGLDCGSWGGYDGPNDGIPSLFLRFEWLLYKFNLPMNLKSGDRYEEIRKHFIKEEGR
jgi:hypothetical protein